MQILHRCKEQRADMKKKKECKALSYIQHNVNTNHFENISKITISRRPEISWRNIMMAMRK